MIWLLTAIIHNSYLLLLKGSNSTSTVKLYQEYYTKTSLLNLLFLVLTLISHPSISSKLFQCFYRLSCISLLRNNHCTCSNLFYEYCNLAF